MSGLVTPCTGVKFVGVGKSGGLMAAADHTVFAGTGRKSFSWAFAVYQTRTKTSGKRVRDMIRQKVRKGGTFVIFALLALSTFAAFGMSQIRLGGPLHERQKLTAEYLADILPPPQYVIEPMLEVTRIVQDPASLDLRRHRLAELERVYHDRSQYWAASELDGELKQRHEKDAVMQADRFWQLVDTQLLPAVERGDMEAAARAYRQADAIFDAHRTAIQALSEESVRRSALAEEEALGTVHTVLGLLGLVALTAMVLVGFGLRRLMSSALDPMLTAARTMRAMAEGDLEAGRCQNHRDDEVGDMTRAIESFRIAAQHQRTVEAEVRKVVASVSRGLDALARGDFDHRLEEVFAAEFEGLRKTFNESLETLGKVVGDVSGSAGRVAIAAEQIGAASSDLARRNVAQAGSVESNLEALGQVLAMLETNEGLAGAIRLNISRAHEDAVQGGSIVAEAVDAVHALEKSSSEIENIVSLIDGIAFQTNLLALNAGVEAARAGEAGRGFAVVASEVRALAQRASDAAADIRSVISASGEEVRSCVLLVGQTGAALGRIVEGMGMVAENVSTIVASMGEQTHSLGSVKRASQAIAEVTQHNAAMAEQSDAAARALIREAQGLDRLVRRLRCHRAVHKGSEPLLQAA